MSNRIINNNTDTYSSNEENQSKIPLKEEFFMSDFEKYYKYGQIPYLFFFQIILVILSTLIIVNSVEELSFFRFYIRNLDSTFIQNDGAPNIDRKSKLIMESIPEVITHLDFVLLQIYSYKENTIKEITPINFDKLEMKIKYKSIILDDKHIRKFDIKSKHDNPLKKMSYTEIRKFLQKIDSFSIKLEYLLVYDTKFENKLKIKWETEVHYGMAIRGRIKFKVNNIFEKYREEPDFYNYIWEELKSGSGLMNICIMILAFCQTTIVVYRLYYGYQCLMSIKRKLEEDEEAYGAKSIKSRNELIPSSDVDSVYIKGRTKWEMLKLTEKKNFFNLWYVLMLVTNFVQVLSSINHLVFPIISNKHELYCSLSCLLSYISCGYFFEYEEKYYFFYLTMKKSFKTHFKYLFVFSIIFIGFGVFLSCTFHYSEKFYSNTHMTFITMFACLFGDSLFDIWNSTAQTNPLITILCAIFFFLFFVAFLMRMLVTITEESFDCIRMRKNYYWLDKKLSVKDYIKNEVVLRDEECENKGGQHYMLSDIVLNLILNANNLIETVDKVSVDDSIQIDMKKLESEGIFKDEVAKIIKKEFKKSMIYESLKDAEHFELVEDQIETKKIKGVYKFIDNVFEKIMASLEKINNVVENFKLKNDSSSGEFNKINQKLFGYANKLNYNLHSIRKILSK